MKPRRADVIQLRDLQVVPSTHSHTGLRTAPAAPNCLEQTPTPETSQYPFLL